MLRLFKLNAHGVDGEAVEVAISEARSGCRDVRLNSFTIPD